MERGLNKKGLKTSLVCDLQIERKMESAETQAEDKTRPAKLV